jgi:DNA-binding NtrC family response regulator
MAEILIVDDDRDIVEALAELLVSEGHRVRVAYDGAEGVDCLRNRTVDLILLDVDMPQLSGPEMAYEVFLMDVGREKIPVVLLSATPDLGRVAAAVGTPYFLGKPYPADDLFRLIARALVEQRPPAPRWASSLQVAHHASSGRG